LIKDLLRDLVTYGTTGAGSRFVSILLVPIYTRVFGSGEYGLLDLLTATSAILILLSGMQIDSGVARSYYKAREVGQDKELIGTGLFLYLSAVAIWTVLSALTFRIWFYAYAGITWAYVVPLLATLLPTQVLGLWLLLMRFQRRPRFFAYLSAGDILTSGLLGVISVVGFGWGIPGVLWGIFASKLVWATMGMKMLPGSFRLVWKSSYAREILTYGVPIVPSVVTKWAQNYASRFVLVVTLTLADVGIFSLAVKIASLVGLVDTAFRLAWDPYAVELMGKPGSEKTYARMLDFYLVAMFGLCATAGALGWLAVRIVAPDAYISAGRFVGFIAMGLLWNGSLQILALGISIQRKTYWGILGFVTGAIVNVVVLYATARQWGLVTAGVAYLLGTITTAMVILYISQHHYHIPYRYSVMLLVLTSSLFLPSFFYLMPEPTASLNAIATDAVPRLLIAGGVWFGIAAFALRREDKWKLLKVVRSIGRKAMAR